MAGWSGSFMLVTQYKPGNNKGRFWSGFISNFLMKKMERFHCFLEKTNVKLEYLISFFMELI